MGGKGREYKVMLKVVNVRSIIEEAKNLYFSKSDHW